MRPLACPEPVVAPVAQSVCDVTPLRGAALGAAIRVERPPTLAEYLLKPVSTTVGSTAHQNEVTGVIVQTIAIQVVDDFIRSQGPPKAGCHDQSMLKDVAMSISVGVVGHANEPVASTEDRATFPVSPVCPTRYRRLRVLRGMAVGTRLGAIGMSVEVTWLSVGQEAARGTGHFRPHSPRGVLAGTGTEEVGLSSPFISGTDGLATVRTGSVKRFSHRCHYSRYWVDRESPGEK